MKKVIAILALVALTGNIASAELLKNFKANGSIETNAYTTNNTIDANSDTKDRGSDVDAFVQINASFDLADDVSAVMSVIRCRDQYGDQNIDNAQNTLLANWDVTQQYLNLKGVLGFDHKIGRQYYGNQGDLVVYYGPKSFPYTAGGGANAMGLNTLGEAGIEGYTGWYKTGKLDMNVLMAKINNNNGPGDTDQDLLGVNAKYDLMEIVKVGAYFYELKDYVTTANAGDKVFDIAGVKANGKFMGFDYSAELAKNFGRIVAQEATGMGMMANVKYNLEVMGKWNFMGEFARGTGDKGTTATKNEGFNGINTDYRPGIVWAGVIGLTGINDLTTWNVGAKWNPSMAEKLTLGGKFYSFAPTEDKVGYTAYGNELDICADWAHNENVGLKAYYAMFIPDSDYAATTPGTWTGEDTVSTLGLALNVKF